MPTPTTPTAQLLQHYLPPKDGRTPADRLRAIAGKALQDGTPRIQQRLGTNLQPEERYDAHSYLTLTGLKCATTYNPQLDQGTTTGIPLDTRFGRFAYLRMRLALIDWERKHLGDRRPGRTRHPQLTSLTEYNDELDPAPGTDLDDLVASRDQLQRWRNQAATTGLTFTAWVAATLDAACGDRQAA